MLSEPPPTAPVLLAVVLLSYSYGRPHRVILPSLQSAHCTRPLRFCGLYLLISPLLLPQALLTAEDAVISDQLNHASIIDGIRLCKAQRLRRAT